MKRDPRDEIAAIWTTWQGRSVARNAPHPAELRASDADRERIVVALGDAVTDGRLTPVEHAERVERAYRARTLGELAVLTADLLPPERQPLHVDAAPVAAFFRAHRRGGRWVVPSRYQATAVGTTVTLDLCEALLQTDHVRLHATVAFGTLQLIVPPGVRVIMPANTVLGGKKNRVPAADGGPVIEVTGTVVCGNIVAKSPRPPRRGLFRR